MAWRIADLVVEGEIDNTVKGRVRGWIRLSDRPEPLRLDLHGDCHPDLAGWRFRVRRLREVPVWAKPVDANGLSDMQIGDAGDITADQMLRDFDCSIDEFLARWRAGEPVPEMLRQALYLEWFSESNGRVVIQSTRLGVEMIGPRSFELTEADLRRKQEDAERQLEELRQQGYVIEETELGVMMYRSDDKPLDESLDESPDESSDERPWTEEEWERFMQKSEARSAKFGELLETLFDNPNRDEIIAREMGWDRRDHEDDPAFDGPSFDEPDPEDLLTDDEWEEIERRDDEALLAIPAYSRGFEWGLNVHKSLQEFLSGRDDLEPDDPLVVAFSDSLVVAAKIAGGHGMGYDEHALCGNIVCCQRSLAAAERAIASLEEIIACGTLPAPTIAPLLEEGREIRALVEQHITDLRSRVWWQ